MVFVDYVFDLLPSGTILFDPELKPSDINVSEGDEFVVKIVNERVVFVKKDS